VKGPTKKSLVERARLIIDRNQLDVPFSAEDVAEFADVTGTHIRFAVRRRNPAFPKDPRHVHVIAYDWTSPQEWSWVKAINISRDRDPEDALRMRRHQREQQALRYCIAKDLREFLDSQWPAECAACGSTDHLTADHAGTPFIHIAREFISLLGPIELLDTPGMGATIADANMEATWIAFHASRASYSVLCRSCNSKKGARGYM
jgi:5-methylcytosine-specific restriction endonuclease McrA